MLDGYDAEKINAILKSAGHETATMKELASAKMGPRGYAGVAAQIIKSRQAPSLK